MLGGVGSIAIVTLLVVVRSHPRHGVVDHSVSLQEARTAALDLGPQEGRVPGCGDCSTEELHYCLGDRVLKDHCCCDGRYLESFPYAPHTCWLAPVCVPVARDCEHYTRVRVCCCDRVTARKWKSLLTSSAQAVTSHCIQLSLLLLSIRILH